MHCSALSLCINKLFVHSPLRWGHPDHRIGTKNEYTCTVMEVRVLQCTASALGCLDSIALGTLHKFLNGGLRYFWRRATTWLTEVKHLVCHPFPSNKLYHGIIILICPSKVMCNQFIASACVRGLRVKAAAWLDDRSRKLCDQCSGYKEHVQNEV